MARVTCLASRALPAWVKLILPLGKEKTSSHITDVHFAIEMRAFAPRIPLGQKLLELRNRVIAAGMQLLSEDEMLEEVKTRRGEMENDGAHVR